MKKRILFVDDEPEVLSGLRRMLRGLRHEWEMVFTESGKQALDLFAEAPFDVVVTDMRMPEMNGAQLLARITRDFPRAIRIVLSGYSDQDMILKSVCTAHQYLSKPCDAETLKAVITRAASLRETVYNEKVREVVAKMETLPSVPTLYARITEVLQSPQASMQEIGDIISQDVGMTAKILQLVNSAFFGLPRKITRVSQAAGLLGLDTIRTLVLTAGVFKAFEQVKIPGFDLDRLWGHSMGVGACARGLARHQALPREAVDTASLAGMLHDAGKLVLAAALPEAFGEIMERARQEDRPLWEVEQETLQTSHAEIGAYLMGAWGLPDAVVEALTFHHQPMKSHVYEIGPLLFTHVGDALSRAADMGADDIGGNRLLDRAYLEKLNIMKILPKWQEICAEIVTRGGEDHE